MVTVTSAAIYRPALAYPEIATANAKAVERAAAAQISTWSVSVETDRAVSGNGSVDV
jgi:hypothetical protein